MKNLKLLAALLALTIGLAGCGGSSKGGSPASSASKNKLDGDNMTASSTQEQEYEEPEEGKRTGFGNSHSRSLFVKGGLGTHPDNMVDGQLIAKNDFFIFIYVDES